MTSTAQASLRSSNPARLQILDDVWLLTILTLVLAIAFPWFVGGYSISLGYVCLGVLALSAIHVGLTVFAGLRKMSVVWQNRVLAVLHAGGIAAVGVVWHYVGGLQNPAFLMVFALPVIGASFVSRWAPYFAAAFSSLVVAVVSLTQSPELRWYATALGNVGAWTASLFAVDGDVAVPFVGFYAPSDYFVVLLEVFLVLMLACGASAEYLGALFERQGVHVRDARADAERAQELWLTLIRMLPTPAFLVEVSTLKVICASESSASMLSSSNASVVGGNLFDVARFSYPDAVRALISGETGRICPCILRVGNQVKMTDVQVRHVAHRRRQLALVTVADLSELFCMRAALDAAEHAALVVDSRGQVMAFNRHVGALFPGTDVGTGVARMLAHPKPDTPWWVPGLKGRNKRFVKLEEVVYQVTTSAVALPGEEENIYTVAFLPVEKITSGSRATRTGELALSTSEPRS